MAVHQKNHFQYHENMFHKYQLHYSAGYNVPLPKQNIDYCKFNVHSFNQSILF